MTVDITLRLSSPLLTIAERLKKITDRSHDTHFYAHFNANWSEQ